MADRPNPRITLDSQISQDMSDMSETEEGEMDTTGSAPETDDTVTNDLANQPMETDNQNTKQTGGEKSGHSVVASATNPCEPGTTPTPNDPKTQDQNETECSSSRRSNRNTKQLDYKSLNEGQSKTDPKAKKGKKETSRIADSTGKKDTSRAAAAKDSNKKEKPRTTDNSESGKKDRHHTSDRSGTNKEELDKLKSEILRLNITLTKQQHRMDDLEKDNDKANRRLNDKTKELANAKDQLTEMEVKNRNLKHDLNEAKREIKEADSRHLKEIKDTKEANSRLVRQLSEAEELTATLFDRVNTQTERPDQTKQDTRPKILIIGDSNKGHILPYLDSKSANWSQIDTIFSIDQLETDLQELENDDEYPTMYDSIIILEGTNDIRKKRNGIQSANQLIEEIKSIQEKTPNTTVFACEIPPFEDRRHQTERNLFNYTLRRSSIPTIPIPQEFKDMPSRDVLYKDGFHLSATGAELFAKALNEAAKATESNNTPTQAETTTTRRKTQGHKQDHTNVTQEWNIPKHVGKFVVGKNGKNIRSMKSELNVEIKLEQPLRESDDQHIKVTGNIKQVEETKARIQAIVEKFKDEQDDHRQPKQDRSSSQLCRFYQQGHCKRGDSCNYQHGTRAATSHSSRSRTPETRSHSSGSRTVVRRNRTPDNRHRSRSRSPISHRWQ